MCSIRHKGDLVSTERVRWAKSFDVPIAEGISVEFPANAIRRISQC